MDKGRESKKFLTEKRIGQRFLQVDSNRPTGTAAVRLDAAGNPGFAVEENVAYDFIEYPSKLSTELVFLFR